MAGIDTRGLASGFTQGFGMMNQYQQQQRQNKRQDRRDEMKEKQFGLQMEQAEMEKKQLEKQQTQEDMQLTLGKIANGMDVSDEEVELLRDNPKYWPALDPATDASIEQAKMVIDPESPVDANDQESLDALNQMFGAEINKGEGGEKRITGMVPAPDGESVMLELGVTGEDGEEYRAPMTNGRSNDPENDDMVMSVPVDRLVEQTQGMRMLRNTFQTPEAQGQASKVLNLLRGESPDQWEQVEGPDGSILQRNTKTGEMKSVMGRSPSRGGGGSYKPPSRIQEARALVAEGTYDNFDDAYKAVRTSAGQISDYPRAKDRINALRDREERITAKLNGEGPTFLDEDEQKEARQELEQVRAELREEEDSTYGIQYSQDSDGQSGGSQKSVQAPDSAIKYLRQNDSPELREQFRAKYGDLPQGF